MPNDLRTDEATLGGVDEFSGTRALVTGGTRGIGAATVARLLAGGATVVAVARNDAPVPAGARLVTADLSTSAGAAEAAERALDVLGGLDVLVNNAGSNVQVPDGVLAADDGQWAINLDANLLSAVRLDRALVPVMTAQGYGSVIHVSSGAARFPQANGVPYAAAKAALNAYSKGLANEVGPSGVRVTVVMPGFVETDTMFTRLAEVAERAGRSVEDLRAEIRERFEAPLGRPGRVGEAAELIAFLASPRASYITATQIMLDGGLVPTL